MVLGLGHIFTMVVSNKTAPKSTEPSSNPSIYPSFALLLKSTSIFPCNILLAEELLASLPCTLSYAVGYVGDL